MGNVKRVIIKFGSMRKEQDWIVYPDLTIDEQIKIQSDTRIALVDPKTRTVTLSKAHQNGSGSSDLSFERGAVVVKCSQDIVNQIIEAQPKSGDHIGGGVFIA